VNTLVALVVLACTPEWGALVQELGGGRVEVLVASSEYDKTETTAAINWK
jgi:hypothetical protein